MNFRSVFVYNYSQILRFHVRILLNMLVGRYPLSDVNHDRCCDPDNYTDDLPWQEFLLEYKC